jgi:hypothetical protein
MAPTTLLASAARTVSGVGSELPISNNNEGLIFLLTITNAGTDAGDLLDVFVQDSMDDGVTWNDLVRFTQVIGTGADAQKLLAHVAAKIVPTTPQGAPNDAAMSAGCRQGPFGPRLRAKWVITDSGTDDATFTFGVSVRQVK